MWWLATKVIVTSTRCRLGLHLEIREFNHFFSANSGLCSTRAISVIFQEIQLLDLTHWCPARYQLEYIKRTRDPLMGIKASLRSLRCHIRELSPDRPWRTLAFNKAHNRFGTLLATSAAFPARVPAATDERQPHPGTLGVENGKSATHEW